MKKRLGSTRIAVIVVVLGCLAMGMPKGARPASLAEYICPPCGQACDSTLFTAAGACPACGMTLVSRSETPMNVAILVFEGVQIIDYTGPYEVFGQAQCNVFTVSKTGKTITTAMSMSVNPAHSFENCPEPDILITPGGTVDGAVNDPEVIDWVRKKAGAADYVLSVCNGAFILAKAGILDGKTATTFYGLIDELREAAPNTRVVDDVRFADNGKVITTAGLSSGIDGSLHVVEKLRGRGAAQRLALHIEYQWDPDSKFARACLPDRLIPRIEMPEGVTIKLLNTGGDRARWENRYEVTGGGSAAAIALRIGEILKTNSWSEASTNADTLPPGASRADGSAVSGWTFKDRAGKAWKASVRVEKVPGKEAREMVIGIWGAEG